MLHKTPLYLCHQQSGAKLVDFAGWEMPLHYGSQIEEHHKVRKDAGMFDVSHMLPVDVHGEQAQEFLRYVLANDVVKINPGKALYSCMLNEQGGVVDDLIVYQLAPNQYRLIVNAGTRVKDLKWLHVQAENFAVQIVARTDLAILAVQGPNARSKVSEVVSPAMKNSINELKAFTCYQHHEWLIARTGYTGEDGFEIILPQTDIVQLWQDLIKTGVAPIGLGARDTLRLEAGLNLYGQDMDEKTTPLVSNLAWTVAFEPTDRNFVGRQALATQNQNGIKQQLVGLVLEGKGVLRSHQKVITEGGEGEITSGSFSPTLGYAIALARIPVKIGKLCQVMIRDKPFEVRIVKPPFVRFGKRVFS